MEFGTALGFIAPYYNLVLVAVLIPLFITLLRKNDKNFYKKPWILLGTAFAIYIVEAILTVLNDLNIIAVSKLVAPIMEMAIISIFIYMLLSQKEYWK